MRYRRTLPSLAAVLALAAALLFSSAPAGAAPPVLTPSATAPGGYHPLAPDRILDTRVGIGAPAAPVGGQQTVTFQVTGQGGVPSNGVGSVVVNLTAVDPTSAGYLSLYAGDLPPPTDQHPSSLNFQAGQIVANMAITTLSPTGTATVFNRFGNTHVLVDVVGWYDTNTSGSRYNPLSPQRIMDTRQGLGPSPTTLGPNATANLTVTGVGGVPGAGVSAVVVNLTATETTSQGFLTVFPQAGAVPNVSNLNFVAGTTRANLVTVGVNPGNGMISIHNPFGNTHVIVDVMGWYGSTGSVFRGVTPTRVADTRIPDAPLQPGEAGFIDFRGQAEVPNSGATAVAMNVTITDPTSAGFLTVYPGDLAQPPNVSNLNWPGPGTSTPNLALVRLPADGEIAFLSPFGEAHVLVDVVGYFASS